MRTLFRQMARPQGPPPRENLLESAAGTGKTRGIQEICFYLCEEFKNVRILWLRRTRVSMSETVLRTFEDLVLTEDHPLLADGLKRANRKSYDFQNGSKIILAGMDNPHNFRSGEYDLIVVFEATEITLEEYEMLIHRMRAGNLRTPQGDVWQAIVCDTNPDAEDHWLNQRAKVGKMQRLCAVHEDNPRYYDAKAQTWTQEGRVYIDGLESMTGVRYLRYRKGLWCAAEGAIWPEFTRARHVIYELKSPLLWAFGVIDWGFREPGCLHIYGVDSLNRVTLLREVYKRGWYINAPPAQAEGEMPPLNGPRPSWSARIKTLEKEVVEQFVVKPQVYICDHAEPRSIEELRAVGIPARDCIKETMPSIEAVGRRFTDNTLFIMADCNREIDPDLVSDPRIHCGSWLDEISSYVYRKGIDGKPLKEEPDPKCVDHGCACARYGMLWMERKDLTETPRRQAGAVSTWAGYFDIEGEMERQKEREAGWQV